MLCENCKERDAEVHLTRIMDNAVTQRHLCEKCAKAEGVETTLAVPQHPLGDILQAVQASAASTASASEDATSCTFCGATARDFRATGRLGCPHCYDAMERSLRELLRHLHGNSKHVGIQYHVPTAHVLEKPDSVHDLRDRLRRAVETEQFELAAELRDRLRVLE
jgi:protein arginine kinase activator